MSWLLMVFLVFLLIFQFFLLFLLVGILSILLYSIISVPWVPTHARIGRQMFKLAKLQPAQTVVDFGCGDGSLLITAVKEFGAKKGIGYDRQPFVRWFGYVRIYFSGLSGQVEIRKENFFKAEFPQEADLIASYLFPKTQVQLEPLLRKAYPKGTRVISRTFTYPTLELIETEKNYKGENLYLYQL
jgi:hypothetical protein